MLWVFRQMRRSRQALSAQESVEVLQRGKSGVLALAGAGDYPYAVPLSYVFDGGRIYFHCAREGHKLDVIRKNGRASFCVIDQDQVVPEKYTTRFRSVIAFGRIRVMEDEAEKRAAIEKLAVKYAPMDTPDRRDREITESWQALCMLEMEIDCMTGKEGMELIREKQEGANRPLDSDHQPVPR